MIGIDSVLIEKYSYVLDLNLSNVSRAMVIYLSLKTLDDRATIQLAKDILAAIKQSRGKVTCSTNMRG